MVLIQKSSIFQLFFFRQYSPRKCLLRYTRKKKKTPLQATKTRSSKSRKIDIFSKGLTHGFGLKMAIFPISIFWQNRPGKYLLRYASTKKRLSRQYKQEVQKVEKWTFFLKELTHGFGPKIAIFSSFIVQAILARKISFYDILARNNAILGYKNKKLKSSKN